MRDSRYWWLNPLLVTCAAFGLGFASAIGVANAQLVPPPPVRVMEASDSFGADDRRILNALYRMTRAMHTRLFPLQEEERIMRNGGGAIEISH